MKLPTLYSYLLGGIGVLICAVVALALIRFLG
jgi:hypothetical protein